MHKMIKILLSSAVGFAFVVISNASALESKTEKHDADLNITKSEKQDADINTTKSEKQGVDLNTTKSEKQGADLNTTIVQSKALKVVAKREFPVTAMQVDFDGYVSVILIDTEGKRSLLLPSRSTPDTYIEKEKPITMLAEEAIMALLPDGLHYLMIVASEQRLVLGATTKEKKSFSALKDDAMMVQVLDDLRSGRYGKFKIKMLPVYK